MTIGADSPEEADWIAATRRGDSTAFVQLVRRHQARVRAFIGAYLRQPDEVDDLAQDVFVAAFNDFKSYEGDAPLGGWFVGIARHRVLNRLRKAARESRSLAALVEKQQLEALEHGSDTLIERERQIQALSGCVDKLPEHSAELVRQHYFAAESVAEIARRGGKNASTLRMQLLRIREVLRDCIEHRLQEPT
ncbi:MAG TPA: sigma-70 family RNA polymerase sigma factor [Polyangiaceae bacterium]|jgi:RNA polymerase sigma-70 factor (ECF subfamily)|nr:sigma-70 family RNA polymerase sigma factor [Polyangiaceae bacterium]